MLDLEFHLKPSKYYQLILSITFIASMMIPFCLAIDYKLKFLLLGLIGIYGVILFFQSRRISCIRRTNDGDWHLYTTTNRFVGKLDKSTTVTRFVSILCFRSPNRLRLTSCVIFSDALPPHLYRRLLVMLRLSSL
jgi:hypothetical protein